MLHISHIPRKFMGELLDMLPTNITLLQIKGEHPGKGIEIPSTGKNT